MKYLHEKYKTRLTLDQTYPDIDVGQINDGAKWNDFYGDVKESKSYNAPETQGRYVDPRTFVDSDHVEEETTRRLGHGYLIYMNIVLITWFAKKQPIVECS